MSTHLLYDTITREAFRELDKRLELPIDNSLVVCYDDARKFSGYSWCGRGRRWRRRRGDRCRLGGCGGCCCGDGRGCGLRGRRTKYSEIFETRSRGFEPMRASSAVLSVYERGHGPLDDCRKRVQASSRCHPEGRCE